MFVSPNSCNLLRDTYDKRDFIYVSRNKRLNNKKKYKHTDNYLFTFICKFVLEW